MLHADGRLSPSVLSRLCAFSILNSDRSLPAVPGGGQPVLGHCRAAANRIRLMEEGLPIV